jgi:hypothetical protein
MLIIKTIKYSEHNSSNGDIGLSRRHANSGQVRAATATAVTVIERHGEKGRQAMI